jgi:CAP12/Pycsar effector protein, TIR domain
MTPPRLFVASSSEAISLAKLVAALLTPDVEVVLWTDSLEWDLTVYENQSRIVETVDFVVALYSPDDGLSVRRGEKFHEVPFDIGLFVGKLGIERCFVIMPASRRLRLPAGLTIATYEGEKTDLADALIPACDTILRHVEKLGKRDRPGSVLRKIFVCYRRDDTQDAAGRLYDKLVDVYGEDTIFMDIDDIPAGANFVESVAQQLAHCPGSPCDDWPELGIGD